MSQELTFTVTIEVSNTKGIRYNASEMARNVVGWGLLSGM